MGRASGGALAWAIVLLSLVSAFAGCEAILDVSSLKDRASPDAGGDDGASSGSGSGSGSSAGSEAGSSGAGSGSGSGADAGSSSGTDGGSSGGGNDGGACTPGAQRCAGDGVETCGASGVWGAAWPCATGMCTGNACTGTTTAGTSCTNGGEALTHCGGSTQTTGGEGCCTSLEVPGGTYDRTYTNDGTGATGESDPATVSGFRLDKYLVTVGRFRQFVIALSGGATSGYTSSATGYMPKAGDGKHAHLNGGNGLNAVGSTGPYEPGWVVADDSNVVPSNANLACNANDDDATWTDAPGAHENLAINCVTWWEAYAFCIWDGGFLPSEAEWEYVAAAGSQQREYPWGPTDPSLTSGYAIYQCNYPPSPGSCMTTGVNVAPVGVAPQGAALWHQLDMAGNMWEWALDWYADSYVVPCTDCTNLTISASGRTTRGGSFATLETTSLLSAHRDYWMPGTRDVEYGFRCARAP
jgi:sulfatase modifying factor 1